MNGTFMQRVKRVSEIAKLAQKEHGHDKMAIPIPYTVEIDDFIELVRIAEEYETYKRNTENLLAEINRQLNEMESEVISLKKDLKGEPE